MKHIGFAIIILLFFTACSKTKPLAQTTYLHANWQFSNTKDTIWYPATVPGVIHTDLLANKLIEDPFWETNELKSQWIENENWQYKTTFTLSEQQIQQDNIELTFEGLDTYATVYVNGIKCITANNMFRSWKVNIKNKAKKGENILLVQFHSPIQVNAKKVKKYPHKLPSGNEIVELKVSPFTRKAAYHFGWDWGPRFVTAGIWKKVKITTWDSARIIAVFVQTDSIHHDEAFLTVKFTIESQLLENQLLANELLEIKLNEEIFFKKIKKGIQTIEIPLRIEQPVLWWPNGMGKPHLYDIKLSLHDKGNILAEANQKYGIRTVELIQKKDSIGTSFFFKINGKAMFAKGANYIPQDMFLPRVADKQYEDLLDKVVNANMNMLRVWGGGIYEKDIFYDLCDEKGILIWQDFMFAGSLYPSDTAFIENVRQEVIENVTRLRKHPCIALWCGNNEIEVAWANWGWQKQYGYSTKDSIEIWANYRHLFHQVIPNTLKDLQTKAFYVSTSPISNWGKPENFKHSSMHYWGVWHGREPFENFKTNVGRFMVEYGFQSFPSMTTIRKFAVDSSLYLSSATMQNRQKSYIGNGLITQHIKQYFSTPISFEDFVKKSQQTQAIGMKIAIQSHLSQSPHCMGSLFWQLNDCWPGPSWSVIDYYGEEKVAYEVVKENFK